MTKEVTPIVGLNLLECFLQSVTTLTEIETAADALPKEQLLAFLAAKLGRAGLHAGAWEVTQDFDAALPDEFWLGRDA